MTEFQEAPAIFGQRESEQIDLRAIGQIFRRRAKVFLVVASIVFVVPLIFIMLLPTQYTATSRVLIERRTIDVTDSTDIVSALPGDSATVDTEVQRLSSRALATHIVETMDLDKDKAFQAEMNDAGPLGLGALFRRDSGGSVADSTEYLMSRLDVERSGLTYVININYTARDPALAARIANAVATEYLVSQRELKLKSAQEARSYLDSQLRELNRQTTSAEQAASNIRARTGIPSSDRLTTFDEQASADLSGQVIAVETELADKRARLAAAQRARGNPGALPEVLSSQVVRDLRDERAKQAGTVAQLQSRYGDQHPDLVSAKRQLAVLDEEITQETNRIISGLSSEVEASGQKLSVIRGALAAQRGASVRNAQATAAIGSHDRDAAASRDLYDTFRKRAQEASAATDLATADATIAGQATLPDKPSGPPRLMLLLAAAAGAAALGALAVVIAEMLDVKLSSGSDIRRHLDARLLTSIPLGSKPLGDQQALEIIDAPMSRFTESYRGLAASVTKRLDAVAGSRGRVVMVSSPLPHEGKTTVSAALALTLGQTGKRTLLIDADLHRPRVCEALGIEPGNAGLANVLGDPTTMPSAICRDRSGTIHILPALERNQGIYAVQDGSFAALIDRLRGLYDYVVIDTPPVLATSEARLVAGSADGVLFIVRWRRTSRHAAKAAMTALESEGAPLLGVVMSHVDLRLHSLYSRDDALAYYSSYKQYYSAT